MTGTHRASDQTNPKSSLSSSISTLRVLPYIAGSYSCQKITMASRAAVTARGRCAKKAGSFPVDLPQRQASYQPDEGSQEEQDTHTSCQVASHFTPASSPTRQMRPVRRRLFPSAERGSSLIFLAACPLPASLSAQHNSALHAENLTWPKCGWGTLVSRSSKSACYRP
jgi:hypothetical protein